MITIKNRKGEVLREVADLQNANLWGANLRLADLQNADLWGANLRLADLQNADLWGANLRFAYLRGADLRGANLQGADLQVADLQGADLRGANLWGADLQGANLRLADLQNADLWGANLQGADLQGANLQGADLRGNDLAVARLSICPEGTLRGYKQARDGRIITLSIPEGAARSNATGRKCRAEYAVVVAIDGGGEAGSIYDDSTIYRVGEKIYPDSWDTDRWNECSHGIHFYLTRAEAEAHV